MESSLTLHNLILALFVVLVLVLLLTAGLLAISYYKFKKISTRQRWLQIIDEKITQTIVDGYQPVTKGEDLAALLKNKAFRLLLLESLVASTRKFSGSAAEELIRLYIALNLKKDALEKLNKGNKIYQISEGIQELTAMKTLEVLPEIPDYLSNPNEQIYQEAQYALVRLKGFEGLSFLHDLSNTLSDWQQMRILDAIRDIPDTKRYLIADWLKSTNNSVIIFTLRLIRTKQLLGFYNNVAALITHPNQKVRIQTVKTLQALENEKTLDLLINIFEKDEVSVQKEILKALKISKNKNSETFLKLQLLHNQSSQLKMIAAEALSQLDESHFLHSLKNDADPTVSLIVKHILQEKI